MHRLVRCGARSAPMGIPVTRECALPGCEMLSTSIRAKDGGVYFDVSVLFAPREARKPPVGEVCAIANRCSIGACVVRWLFAVILPMSKQWVAVQLWACCAAHKAAALREVLKVRTLRFFSCSTWIGSYYLHAWRRQHCGSVCVGGTCRRCPSCPSRSRPAARARCLTSCWRRRSASS